MSNSKKIFRDPIHNMITFDKYEERVLLELIDLPVFQRLKRIKQLGFSYYTYPGATHDRFSHSLGVCHLAGRMFEMLNCPEIIEFKDEVGEHRVPKSDLKLVVKAAALLHDIGHGPFSHVFESITKQHHEKYTIKIVGDAKCGVKDVLERVQSKDLQPNIVRWVKSIINKTFPLLWVKDIISSQFDADRIDYLLRDAYMCGVRYSKFDSEWIFTNMQIEKITAIGDQEGIVINAQKGIYSLESFIISRFHMYEQVYFHKTTRGVECLTRSLLKRVNFLINSGKESELIFIDDNLKNILQKKDDIESYLILDDLFMFYHFYFWSRNSTDHIVKFLAKSITERKLFKLVREVEGGELFNRSDFQIISEKFSKDEEEYYLLEDSYFDNPYKDNFLLGKGEYENIWVSKGNSTIKVVHDITQESDMIDILRNKVKKLNRLFVPRDKADFFLQN